MEELKVGDIIKERYSLIRFLGNGSFGEVWLSHDQLSGRDVALKIYLTLDPAGVEEFQREYANTIDLSSPYLLTPEYFDVYGRRPFLVMKYCENGSSSKLVGNVTEDLLWQFIQDVANGLAVLHNQLDPIVHQDIKPDNILIDGNGRFLITDFGISKRLRATMRRQSKRDVSSGAMPYMAPERFNSNPRLSTASDIWSLGASIYELAVGELPFSGFGGAMQRNGADMPSLPSPYSYRLNAFMQSCLSLDENARPSISQLLECIRHNNESNTYNNNDITSCKISKTNTPVELNIAGNVTQTLVKPYFNNAFGWIWFFCVLFLSSIIVFLPELHSALYMNGPELPVHMIIRGIALLAPVVMWFWGYIMVKRWDSIGKYLMCGAIYLIAIFWIYGFIGSLIEVVPKSSIPNKENLYNYVELIIGISFTGLFYIASLYGLFSALRFIKKGDKLNPVVWKYSGSITLPILYEFIFPSIALLLYITSWITK